MDMQLTGSGFVITPHLLLYYLMNLFRDYCSSTTASLPSDGSFEQQISLQD